MFDALLWRTLADSFGSSYWILLNRGQHYKWQCPRPPRTVSWVGGCRVDTPSNWLHALRILVEWVVVTLEMCRITPAAGFCCELVFIFVPPAQHCGRCYIYILLRNVDSIRALMSLFVHTYCVVF